MIILMNFMKKYLLIQIRSLLQPQEQLNLSQHHAQFSQFQPLEQIRNQFQNHAQIRNEFQF